MSSIFLHLEIEYNEKNDRFAEHIFMKTEYKNQI